MSLLREIRVPEIINDIRGGMTDSEMMGKYRLSSDGLAGVFKKLLDTRALTSFEFVQWSSLFCESPEVKNIRLFPRDSLNFRLPIYEAGRSELRGEVLNISDGGLAIRGIDTRVHETRLFVVPIKGAPTVFKAECRWIRKEPPNGATVSGFDVVKVVKGNWEKLVQLLQAEKVRRQEVRKAETSPAKISAVSGHDAPVVSGQGRAGTTPTTGMNAYDTEAVRSGEPPSKIDEPANPASIPDEPTLSSVQQCLDSENYLQIFTNKRYLTFIVNPLNFTELSPEKRREMSDRVRDIAKLMLADLRRRANAFRLAIENGSLLASP